MFCHHPNTCSYSSEPLVTHCSLAGTGAQAQLYDQYHESILGVGCSATPGIWEAWETWYESVEEGVFV